MVDFIFGRTGYGKSAELYEKIRASATSGRKVWLVVPEQEAVNAERTVAALYGDDNWIEDPEKRRSAVRRIEVTTFSRLCDEAARAAGRINCSRLDGSAETALVYRALCEAAGELKTDFFASFSGAIGLPQVDAGALSSLSALISALRSECVGPEKVEKAAQILKDGNDADCDRLFDLAAIYRRFIASGKLSGDAEGRLSKLISDLGRVNIFRGCDVYIDRFYTYTGQEYSVIRHMIAAHSLTVTVPADRPDSTEEIFAPAISAYEKICSIANDAGVQAAGVKICGKPIRFRTAELAFISEHFSDNEIFPSERQTTAIKAAECSDRYREAEFVASDILGHVYAGERFSDCAVVVRDIGSYRGICDAVFSRRGIPYFMSKRTDAASKPPVKYLTAALSAITHSYRKDDVLSWLKTGMCSVSEQEISQLISYITLWDLSGQKLCRNSFTLSPDGFDTNAKDDAGERLEELMRIRGEVMAPLFGLRRGMDGAATVGEKCRALYDFLIRSEMPEKIAALSDDAKKDGDAKEAADLAGLWEAICTTLDTLNDMLGDIGVGKSLKGTEHFRRLLAAVFSADIGIIPTAKDEVVVADAALTRLGEIKHVYVMGAEEGVFPRSGEDDPFSPVRDQLLRGGIDLHNGIEEYWQTENYRFYNAICSASDTLTLTCSKHDERGDAQMRSEAFDRVLSAFSLKAENGDDLPPERRLFSPDDFIREAAATQNGELRAILESKFGGSERGGELKEKLRVAMTPLRNTGCRAEISASKLFSGKLRLSPSRLTDYVECGFYYFCNSMVRLNEKKAAVFGQNYIGSYVHTLMEKGVEYAVSEGYSDDGLGSFLSDVSNDYFAGVYGGGMTNRMRTVADQMIYMTGFVIKDIRSEFLKSRFKPVAYEISIGGGNGLPAYRIGSDAELTGKIDRLDVCDENGKTYVRVVDYKTGYEDFTPGGIISAAEEGGDALPRSLLTDMQLILYLFSVKESKGRGVPGIKKGADIVPAGIIYHLINGLKFDKAQITAKKFCLVDDKDILTAMDPGFTEEYVPVKLNRDGTIRKSGSRVSQEMLTKIKEMTEAAISSVAADMKRGRIDADPLNRAAGRSKSDYRCRSCGMWPICRSRKENKKEEENN